MNKWRLGLLSGPADLNGADTPKWLVSTSAVPRISLPGGSPHLRFPEARRRGRRRYARGGLFYLDPVNERIEVFFTPDVETGCVLQKRADICFRRMKVDCRDAPSKCGDKSFAG